MYIELVLDIDLYFYQSIHVYVELCMYITRRVYISTYRPIYTYIDVSMYSSVTDTAMPGHHYTYLDVDTSIYLSTYLYIYISI